MNKRITSILAASILAVSMVGCSDNINKKDDTTNNVKQEQQIEKKNTNTNKDKVDTNKESTLIPIQKKIIQLRKFNKRKRK